jgi:hypothetical protein
MYALIDISNLMLEDSGFVFASRILRLAVLQRQ